MDSRVRNLTGSQGLYGVVCPAATYAVVGWITTVDLLAGVAAAGTIVALSEAALILLKDKTQDSYVDRNHYSRSSSGETMQDDKYVGMDDYEEYVDGGSGQGSGTTPTQADPTDSGKHHRTTTYARGNMIFALVFVVALIAT